MTDKGVSLKEDEVFEKAEEKRKKTGLTQRELSKKIGYTEETYSRWVTGKENPGPEAKKALFKWLKNTESILQVNDGSGVEYYAIPNELQGSDPEHVYRKVVEE